MLLIAQLSGCQVADLISLVCGDSSFALCGTADQTVIDAVLAQWHW